MGFYGNISNTSKTTFQFDRTYANRRDMDHGAALGDGVYPGRYVLIDYNENINESFYEIDNILSSQSDIYWMYDGKLYIGSPSMVTIGKEKYYSYPDAKSLVTPDDYTFSAGKLIKIPVGRRVGNINTTSKYFKVTNVTADGKYEVSYDANFTTYDAWLTSYITNKIETDETYSQLNVTQLKAQIDLALQNTYRQVELSDIMYEPGTFYIQENGKYILDTKTAYDESKSYYERVENKDFQIYVTSSTRNTDGWKYGEDVYASTIPLEVGHIYRIPKYHKYSTNYLVEYWQVNTVSAEEYTWKAVIDSTTSTDNYFKNMSIDRAYVSEFGDNTGIASRGYDSTVWQKVVRNGQDRYVMIAELNSVVPTFDISFDPPTAIPLIPHFDKDSTNVYYKLHTQPQWGFRTKAANSLSGPSFNEAGGIEHSVNLSSDKIIYPSDQKTRWKSDFYNKYTGESFTRFFNATYGAWVDKESEENDINAAIYYNKKGFLPENISYSADIITEGQKAYDGAIATSGWRNNDKIVIQPTGFSGQKYAPHDNGQETKACVDTQELSIMLPSLGDSISKVWDIVFGGRDTNDRIKATNSRNMNYQWEDGKGIIDRNGLRLVDYKNDNPYNTAHVNTLAGCINSVHDLMGMIITGVTSDVIADNLQNLHKDRIYYVQPTQLTQAQLKDETIAAIAKLEGQYTMKHKTYDYTVVTLNSGYEIEDGEIATEDITNYYVKNANGSYRKATAADSGPFYKLIKVAPDEDSAYEEISDDMKIWEDKYWYQDINSSPHGKNADGSIIPEKQDYIKGDKYQKENKYFSISGVTEVEISGSYESGKYYYKTDGAYLLDFSESSTLGRTYYTINESLMRQVKPDYDGIYLPGLYYYYDGEDYYKDMSINGTRIVNGQVVANVHYAVKMKDKEETEQSYVKEVHWVTISSSDVATLLVTGNEVYYRNYNSSGSVKDDNGKPFDYVLMSKGDKVDTSGTTIYAVQQIIYTPAEEQLEIDTTKQLNLTPYKTNTFFFKSYEGGTDKFLGYVPVKIEEVDPLDANQQFYTFGKWDGDKLTNNSPYIATTDSGKTKYNWALQEQSTFYTPHVYHYVTDDGSYILDNYPTMTHEKYVKLDASNISAQIDFGDTIFYEPNEYYTKNPITDEYELIRDTEMPTDVPIYKADKYYVYEDKAGIYEKGSEWNMDITEVPSTVTLATRKERWELIPLEDFARNLNTMHGLILKINQTLLSGDKLTRDDNTVQGVINRMRDLVARFERLTPERIMIVDDYGRIRGGSWSSDQTNSINKTKKVENYATGVNEDKFPKVAHDAAKVNQWITLNVDGTITNPMIRIHHNFQPVTNTTDTWDLNTNAVATAAAVGVTKDVMTLYEPYVDLTGHVVGNHKRTYVLPYGFKNIETNGRSNTEAENASSTPTTTKIVADSTQDTFKLNSGNKWIRIDTNASGDALSISHDIHNFDADGTSSASLSNETSQAVTFNTVTYNFDKAGHFTGKSIKTLTMPFGYGKIAGDSGNTAATATFDTLTFGSDDWLIATVSKDKVVFSHDYPKKVDDTTSTSDVNGNGNTIVLETIARDDKGHVTKVNQNTVTLPFGYKTFADSNATVGKSIAASTQDTFVFKGDSWLKPTVTSGLATFTHIGPVAGTHTSKTNATPKFGETFSIEDWYFDAKGHKYAGESHTVTIPSLSLTNDTSGNVVTGLTLTPADGAFVETKENLSSLKLTGYTKGTSNADIAATDTLAQALSKLQTQINDEENARAQAIRNLLGGDNINEAFDTIQEIAAWLEGNDSGADGIIDAVATLNGADTVEGSVKKQIKDTIETLDVIDTEVDGQYVSKVEETDGKISVSRKDLPSVSDEAVDGQYVKAVSQEKGKITITRETLPSVEDVEVEGEYISAVSESNGKINVTRKALPTISDMAIAVDEENLKYEAPVFADETEETEFNNADKTIAWLFQKVAQLENRIIELENSEEEIPTE